MSSQFLDLTKLLKLVACLSSSWTKNLNSMLAEQLVTFFLWHSPKIILIPQGYRKDNWLKVQRQSTNRSRKLLEGSTSINEWFKEIKFTKAEMLMWRVQTRPQPGGKKYRLHDTAGQRKCKKGAAEIGKLKASSLSIF